MTIENKEDILIDTKTGEIEKPVVKEIETNEDSLTGLKENPIDIEKEDTVDYGDLPESIFEGEDISKEKLAEVLKANDTKLKGNEKRVNDLRAKLSKKDKPEEPDGYFFKSEEFDGYINGNEEIKDGLNEFKKKCHAKGLGQNEFEFMAEELLTQLKDNGVIDIRTKEDKAKYVAEQKAIIGDNADEIIDANIEFVKKSQMFSEEEKNIVLNLMGQGAGFIKIMDKITKQIGRPSVVPINPAIVNDGLASDVELYVEYMTPATSDIRRQEINSLRHKAGRTSRLSEAKNLI